MKRLLPLFLFVQFLIESKAQIIFCPPGAEWHYSFYNNLPYSIINEKIKYIGKAVIGLDTMLYIEHYRFFNQLNFGHFVGSTYFKQKGDTVFVKNNITSQNWQILYNFNVQPGHSWHNNLTNGKTYTVTVDSVNHKVVNGHNLKQLFVHYQTTYYNNPYTYTATILERFGCTTYLFNFFNDTSSDGDYIDEFLCYQDSTFGQIQFTNKPCNYSNLNGLLDLDGTDPPLTIFPNPSSDKVHLSFKFEPNDLQLCLYNTIGAKVYFCSNVSEGHEIDMTSFESGIYFLKIQNSTSQRTFKLIKE